MAHLQVRIMYKVVLLLILISTQALATDCSRYDKLTPIQKGRLEFAYHQGLPTDLGYTLAAISLNESNAGKWRLNLHSKDVGLFQVNIVTASRTLGVTNYYNKLELAEKLIYDDILNAYIALEVLNYFKAYYKGDWSKMVQAYNAGFKINTIKSLNYLASVRESVIMLTQCMNTTT